MIRKKVANLFGASALPALVVGALMLLSPFGATAQRGGGHGGGGGGRSAGGGFRGGGAVGGGFRGGGAVGGYGGGYYGGFRGGYYGGWGLGLGFGYPYGYGYPYYGGYGYDPYAYGYDPYSYGGYDTTPAPPVNAPQYGYPQGQPYPQGQYPQGQAYLQQQPYPPQYQQRYPPQTQPQQPQQPQIQPQSAPAPNQGQVFYLIAFSDHTIQAATAYKVDGDQIHWIGRDGAEKQAPLSTVDVRFSKQINRDRQVDFEIP